VKYDIRNKPSFATIFVTINPGETLVAEAGAMASMAAGLTVKTEFSGGFFPALLKKFLGGESLFVNVFHNDTQNPQELVLTQSSPGDITCLELKGNAICFQPGAYIASSKGIKIGVEWAGFSSFFAGEGLFRLKLNGNGIVFFGCYGGLTKYRVDGQFTVDSEHLVAYEPGLKLNIGLAGGLMGSITSGEGLVNRITGHGDIYMQSRSIGGLVKFLTPKCYFR